MQPGSAESYAPLNREAFQSFYRENLGLIYRYVYRKVGNREEAEDLTSHVFVKAVRHLDQSRDARCTRNWLFQVARTTIADYWRASSRTNASSLDALLEAGWEGPPEDADQLFEFNNSAEYVQHILQALAERDREILTCRFLRGLSIRETASKLGMTEGNVKATQFRALKRAAHLADTLN